MIVKALFAVCALVLAAGFGIALAKDDWFTALWTAALLLGLPMLYQAATWKG